MGNPGAQIEAILERNRRVEADKRWETSFTRRGFIAIITYAGAYVFIAYNNLPNPEVQALIPAFAYVISTLSLPSLQRFWKKHHSTGA